MPFRKPRQRPEPLETYVVPLTPEYLNRAKQIERWYRWDRRFTWGCIAALGGLTLLQLLACLTEPGNLLNWVTFVLFGGLIWTFYLDLTRARRRRADRYRALLRDIAIDDAVRDFFAEWDQQEGDQA